MICLPHRLRRRSTFPNVRLETISIHSLPLGMIMLRPSAIYHYPFIAKAIAIAVATMTSRINNEVITLLDPKPRQYRIVPTVPRAKPHQPSTSAGPLGILPPDSLGIRPGRGECPTARYLVFGRTLSRHFSCEKLMSPITPLGKAMPE